MFSKPLSLFLVYLLIICNFTLLLLPFLLAIFPFLNISGNQASLFHYISFSPKIALFLLIFTISFLMLCYLILDFLFGFSVSVALKGCKRFEKLKDYQFLEGIWSEVRFKFSSKSTKLYIKKSDEINAFAIGGMRRKAVVLTSGLINHYATNSQNSQLFLDSLRSIIGHEMSHLINKDFLPGLLMMTNQKITNFVSNILMLIFTYFIRITSLLRFAHCYLSEMIMMIYRISNWILTGFNRFIVINIYEFLRKFLGRAVEYRCDRQSAKAFGGIDMSNALSMLRKSGYFTLFSTHPATQRRMKKVETVEEKNAIIRPSFSSQVSNFASLFILPIICLYAAHLSKLDLMVKYFIFNHYPNVYFGFFSFYAKISPLIQSSLEQIKK